MDPEGHLEDGKDMVWWVRVYFDYTSFVMGAPLRMGWPGGAPVEEQPALLVAMFNLVEQGVLKAIELDAEQRNRAGSTGN